MKKILFILSMILAVLGCSDNNDSFSNEGGSIVGYWKFDYASPLEVITDSEANTQKIKTDVRNNKGFTDWEFLKDGTYIEYDIKETYKGTYSIHGDYIILDDEEYDDSGKFKINKGVPYCYIDLTDEYKMDFPKAGITKVTAILHYSKR